MFYKEVECHTNRLKMKIEKCYHSNSRNINKITKGVAAQINFRIFEPTGTISIYIISSNFKLARDSEVIHIGQNFGFFILSQTNQHSPFNRRRESKNKGQ